jgi:large subunit ribosomal protein L25
MEESKLIAKKRDLEGSSNARRLRNDGSLPGVIYGGGKDSASITFDAHDFEQLLHHSASESVIVEIDLEGEGSIRALVKDVQHHPVTGSLVHVDLQRVVAGQAIQVSVPLELVGEAAGVKAGGIVDHVLHEIAIEVLPRNMVESFEIDISELEIGDSIQVADLNLGADFKVLADEEAIVASVAAPRTEEEVEEEEAAAEEGAAEPEVITEKKDEEEAG